MADVLRLEKRLQEPERSAARDGADPLAADVGDGAYRVGGEAEQTRGVLGTVEANRNDVQPLAAGDQHVGRARDADLVIAGSHQRRGHAAAPRRAKHLDVQASRLVHLFVDSHLLRNVLLARNKRLAELDRRWGLRMRSREQRDQQRAHERGGSVHLLLLQGWTSSAPLPKFVTHERTLSHELRKQRGTS